MHLLLFTVEHQEGKNNPLVRVFSGYRRIESIQAGMDHEMLFPVRKSTCHRGGSGKVHDQRTDGPWGREGTNFITLPRQEALLVPLAPEPARRYITFAGMFFNISRPDAYLRYQD